MDDRQGRKLISLKRTALSWLAGLLLVIGLATAAVSYLLVQQDANDFLDSQLRQVAYFIGDAPHSPVQPAPNEPQFDPDDNFLVQIWAADGGALRSSDQTVAIPRQTMPGFSQADVGSVGWRTYTFVTPERTVQISERMVVRQELAADAALRSAVPILALIPLCWLILGYAITRVMRRLDRLAARVEARAATDRSPIPLADVPIEVAPLVVSMNGAMERLQQAIERQRRFVSDAAHELRTPLAALQLQIENLRAVEGAALEERLTDVEAGIRRSTGLVTQLLRLARYDAETTARLPETICLRDLIQACLRELCPLASRQGVATYLATFPDLAISADRAELKVLFCNIIDNAIRYTPSGGSVAIRADLDPGGARIEVRDTGPGIPAALQGRVFERFFRAAPQEIEGSGLGLSIAKQIADRNGLSIGLENLKDAGLKVMITIPPDQLKQSV